MVHCVTNCIEAGNESKHKKATATCYNLYSVVASKHDSYACGNGIEPHGPLYIHTDRGLNKQLLFKDSVLYLLLVRATA